jgi:electron transfer flavoprotein alpha subunit
VANVAAYIELVGGAPSAASLAGLELARAIGSAWGATVYALLPCAATPPYGQDDAIATIGRHGADKVLLGVAAGLDAPPTHATHGGFATAACARVQPSLLVFPAGAGGDDLAPRVATALGAAYAARPSVSVTDEGIVLEHPAPGGTHVRRLRIEDLERPVVVTIEGRPTRQAPARAEIEVVVGEVAAAPCPLEALPAVAGDAAAGFRRRLAIVIADAALSTEARAALAPRLDRAGARLAGGATPHAADDELVVALDADPASPLFANAAVAAVGEPAVLLDAMLTAAGVP